MVLYADEQELKAKLSKNATLKIKILGENKATKSIKLAYGSVNKETSKHEIDAVDVGTINSLMLRLSGDGAIPDLFLTKVCNKFFVKKILIDNKALKSIKFYYRLKYQMINLMISLYSTAQRTSKKRRMYISKSRKKRKRSQH